MSLVVPGILGGSKQQLPPPPPPDQAEDVLSFLPHRGNQRHPTPLGSLIQPTLTQHVPLSTEVAAKATAVNQRAPAPCPRGDSILVYILISFSHPQR